MFDSPGCAEYPEPMATLLLTISLFALVMAGMAIGVIVKNRPIKGSCGGMGALGFGTACDICGGDMSKCDEQAEEKGQLSPASQSVNENGKQAGVRQWHEAR